MMAGMILDRKGEEHMWNQSKSLRLSEVWIKAALICWIALAVSLPFALRYGCQLKLGQYGLPLLIFYFFSVPLCLVFYCLNRLLVNIKREAIFIQDNVKQLRLISWCCFWGGLILLLGSFWNVWLVLLSGIMGFFGLLMRVIKNVFSEAIIIKEENDFTV